MRSLRPLSRAASASAVFSALVVGCSGGDDPGSAAAACDPATLAPEMAPTARLRVDGTRLRDEHGRQVVLRGAATGGRSKFAPFVPFTLAEGAAIEPLAAAYFAKVAGFGFDVVRMPFSWEALEPERGHVDEAYLDRYEALLDAAWAAGLRVVVDFHQDVYASPFGGDGFPPWTLGPIEHGPPRHDRPDWFLQYYDAGGPVVRAWERFWSDADGIQTAWLAMWNVVASRFAAHPGVVGFELLNEPGWGPDGLVAMEENALAPLVERAARVVRAQAPDALVFQGGAGNDAVSNQFHVPRPSVGGLVFAPHLYDPGAIGGSPLADATGLRSRLDALVAHGGAWDAPTFFGEFGASNASPDQGRYFDVVYAGLDAAVAHGTVWEISADAESWNGENLGLLAPDGARVAGAAAVERGYPRAVAGTIRTFAWDRATRTLTLDVVDAFAGVSEIFVPIDAPTPDVELDHGCARWIAAERVLVVSSDAPAWTLRVGP